MTTEAMCERLNKAYPTLIADTLSPKTFDFLSVPYTSGVVRWNEPAQGSAVTVTLQQVLHVVNKLLADIESLPVGIIWSPTEGGKFVPAKFKG